MKLLTVQQLRALDEKKLSELLQQSDRVLLETQMKHKQEQLKDSSLLKKYRRYKAKVRGVQQEQAIERVVAEVVSRMKSDGSPE